MIKYKDTSVLKQNKYTLGCYPAAKKLEIVKKRQTSRNFKKIYNLTAVYRK